MRARFKDIDEQLRYWFMDKEEGSELYKAYQDFSKLREKDMQLRDKDWTDDSILQERVAAESKFLSIYRRIANRRLKNHMKAYKLKVPEQKNKVLRDFNKIFEDNGWMRDLLSFRIRTMCCFLPKSLQIRRRFWKAWSGEARGIVLTIPSIANRNRISDVFCSGSKP